MGKPVKSSVIRPGYLEKQKDLTDELVKSSVIRPNYLEKPNHCIASSSNFLKDVSQCLDAPTNSFHAPSNCSV